MNTQNDERITRRRYVAECKQLAADYGFPRLSYLYIARAWRNRLTLAELEHRFQIQKKVSAEWL